MIDNEKTPNGINLEAGPVRTQQTADPPLNRENTRRGGTFTYDSPNVRGWGCVLGCAHRARLQIYTVWRKKPLALYLDYAKKIMAET